jgi:hypothetical protein
VIENAEVRLADRTIKTRLHEHGEDRFDGKSVNTGYFDGKLAEMQAILDAKLTTVEIYVDGKLDTTLTGAHAWKLHDWSYKDYDHAVLHVHWDYEEDEDY